MSFAFLLEALRSRLNFWKPGRRFSFLLSGSCRAHPPPSLDSRRLIACFALAGPLHPFLRFGSLAQVVIGELNFNDNLYLLCTGIVRVQRVKVREEEGGEGGERTVGSKTARDSDARQSHVPRGLESSKSHSTLVCYLGVAWEIRTSRLELGFLSRRRRQQGKYPGLEQKDTRS